MFEYTAVTGYFCIMMVGLAKTRMSGKFVKNYIHLETVHHSFWHFYWTYVMRIWREVMVTRLAILSVLYRCGHTA
jgi:hypothetical protein